MVRINRVVSFALAAILVGATAANVGASTFTIASGTNTALNTAQLISLNPNLILTQQAPNYTYATAQPVSPKYQAYEVLGSVNPGVGAEYFSFPLSVGNQFSTFVQAGQPATQATQMFLYEANNNLVAVANGNGSDGSSSEIDHTVPVGDAGNWSVGVSATSSGASPVNYDLRFSGPFLNYQTNVIGTFDDPSHTGFYSVAAKAGDNLHFLVQPDVPISATTELLLFDPNNNLVAVASGNGSDGSSSEIDFTVPAGDTGNWTIEVTSNPSNFGFFNYNLLITGDTGAGPIDPLPPNVPEPSSLFLCGLGALGLLVGASRRKA